MAVEYTTQTCISVPDPLDHKPMVYINRHVVTTTDEELTDPFVVEIYKIADYKVPEMLIESELVYSYDGLAGSGEFLLDTDSVGTWEVDMSTEEYHNCKYVVVVSIVENPGETESDDISFHYYNPEMGKYAEISVVVDGE